MVRRREPTPGAKLGPSIEKAIRECRYFVAIVSSHSVSKKGYVQKELKAAFDILDQYPANQIYVIPVRVEDCIIDDPRLSEIHYVDFFPDYEFGLSKVLRAIQHTLPEAHQVEVKQTPSQSKDFVAKNRSEASASPDQVDSAKQFFESVKTRRQEIRQREANQANALLRKSQQIGALVAVVDRKVAQVVAAFNDAAGRRLLNLQISDFPPNLFKNIGQYRILVSFGSQTYWMVRFVTYPDGTPALQLVKVMGAPEAKVSDNFNLTNDSINLVLLSDDYWMSLNSGISSDVVSEVVRDVERTNRPLSELPGTLVALLRNAIELELLRSSN
jgi:TIR domain